ncbi:MAG: AMP-binding protein [Pseudolabrys sp.]|nr:AMP-binding protein [Pseudolabrys sp.]
MTELHPPWLRASPDDPALTALPQILRRHAQTRPRAPCVTFDDGRLIDYAEAWRQARIAASALRRLGVKRGDPVLVWLPNGPLMMRMWFALNILGAIHIPINVALRGGVLQHVLDNSGAALMVCHPDLVSRLDGVEPKSLRHLIVSGETLPLSRWPVSPERVLDDGDADEVFADATPSDLCTVLYTSGTTGQSKGVLIPYTQMYASGSAAHGYITADDRIYVFTPLFHTVGMSAVYATLTAGGCVHLAESFHAQTFWDDVKRAGCNRILGLISSMTLFLAKSVQDDARSPFDFAMMSPITEGTATFAKRHGFQYFSAFSMTEASVPILSDVDSTVWGSCGRARTGITCRIVDADDNDVPDGEVGELILRSDAPGMLSPGYWNDKEATGKAWRNGWFHTGDAFRRDAGGNFYFVDRLKDAIRRRGENISTVEVEKEILAFPGVMEVAVVGAETGNNDQEVLAVIAPVPGQAIEPLALIEFLSDRLAHFMMPRYVRIMPTLPKTPTNKVRKAELRAAGVTADTWDGEQHGVRIRRQKLA